MDEDSKQTLMADHRSAELASWIVEAGLLGKPHTALLEAYCLKLVEVGVPLMRAHVSIQQSNFADFVTSLPDEYALQSTG